MNDLLLYYNQAKKQYRFNNNWFVFGDMEPLDRNTLRSAKISIYFINNGANVTLVAKYLGHTKIEETLNTYSHMFSTALDSVVSVIDSLGDD